MLESEFPGDRTCKVLSWKTSRLGKPRNQLRSTLNLGVEGGAQNCTCCTISTCKLKSLTSRVKAFCFAKKALAGDDDDIVCVCVSVCVCVCACACVCVCVCVYVHTYTFPSIVPGLFSFGECTVYFQLQCRTHATRATRALNAMPGGATPRQ